MKQDTDAWVAWQNIHHLTKGDANEAMCIIMVLIVALSWSLQGVESPKSGAEHAPVE